MANKFLTLAAWAAAVYGEAAPCPVTLQRWARSGRIQPAPVKHGRTYFVRPEATYTAAFAGRRRLVDRLSDGAKAPKRA